MYRSFLFVPGDRPERFDKAAGSGADAVCIDLEDAVSPRNKAAAREAAISYLVGAPKAAVDIGVRVNALNTADGLRDVLALLESAASPAFALAPKVGGRADVDQLRALLAGRAAIWALMETPQALTGAGALCESLGETGGVVFGGADLSAALGSDMSWDSLYFARASLVAAAAPFGCQTLDVPFLDVRDLEGLKSETHRVKALGFTGRSCIHPDQVAPINEVFTPSREDVEKAQAIIDAYDANDGRVLLHEGRLVEKPVLAAARRTLARRRAV